MKKLVRNNKAKNAILKHLNKTDRLESDGIWDMNKKLGIDINLLFTISKDLLKDEYTTELSTTTRNGDGKIITITRKGKLHINDGGYPSSGIRIIKTAIITNKATIISIIALIVSILSYLKK